MSLIKIYPLVSEKSRFPEGTYLCKAIGSPEEGIQFTRLVIFKEGKQFEKKTNIDFVSLRYGEYADSSIIRIVASAGVIPSKSELGEDGIVCIMQENTPRCESCGLNLVKRFDNKKQQQYMVCPANRWGLNLCNNVYRHDFNCHRESEEDRKQRLLENKETEKNWGEKYGLEYKSYLEYLQSDLWKQKKVEALSVMGNFCKICGSKKNINVHHRSYDRIGEELVEDLSILCKSCHKMIHILIQQNPKQYNIKNCEAKILNMNVSEISAIKQKIKDLPLGHIDIRDREEEVAVYLTESWKKLPATESQNHMLKKFGYKGPSLNKQEAFFKIEELMYLHKKISIFLHERERRAQLEERLAKAVACRSHYAYTSLFGS